MNDDTEVRVPDRAMEALGRLVGTWEVSGDAHGTVQYRWLDGNFFLMQEGEVEVFGHRSRFIEIIGRECVFGGTPSEHIRSRAYTAEGDTLDYTYELTGDELTIWGGEPGSDAKYVGTFAPHDQTLTGSWSWPGGGYAATSTRRPAAANG